MSDDVPSEAEPARKHRRVPVLAVLALAIAVVVFWIASRGDKSFVNPATRGSGGSGAAIRAPEGPQVPVDPTGVRISGTVIDGAGVPVEGAEVTAELEKGVPDKALATPTGPSTDTAHVAAATVGDGKFIIGGLDAGRYRLRVTGPGLLAADVRYVPVPSDEVRIIVARQVRIEGKVVDGTTPVPNAVIGLRGEAIGGTIEMRSDRQGAFAFVGLPEGRYQIFAWQGALAARTVRISGIL